tara:strand:+ start:5192 stop:6526 length:1335 start_codon:yes stop_codon:yes gene_type:complete
MAFPDDVLQDSANYANAMKIRYARAVSETINRKVVLYGILNKTREHWTGKQHEQPVYLRSSNAVGARNEGGNLPPAGSDQYVPSIINNKHNYVVMTVSNIAEAATSDQAGAWASVKTTQLKNRVKDMTDSMNRQFHGDGSGILCEQEGVLAGATVTIRGFDDGTTIVNTSSGANTPRSTRHIRAGMRLAWGTQAQFAAGAGDGHGLVTSVSKTAPFTTFDLENIIGNNPAANDIFVLGGSPSAPVAPTDDDQSFEKECMGVSGIIKASGALQTIDPAVNPEWVAQEFSNPAGAGTERPLTEDLMNQAIDSVNDLSTGTCDLIILHTATQRAYLNMLKAKGQERFAPLKLAGGYMALSYHHDGTEIPLLSDKDCRHRAMFFLSKEDLKVYETSAFRWDESGSAVWKWVTGKDQVTAFGRTYSNLGTSNRTGHARVSDLAVTGIVA